MQFPAIESIEPAGRDLKNTSDHRLRLVISPDHAPVRSPFLVMAEDWIAPGAGFPLHPHRGMETVTFVLEGQMLHGDHMGGKSTLNAGDVAFMTAGRGVLHSEIPGPEGVHSLQLWLNLPARLKRTPPRYQPVRKDDVPIHTEAGVEARVYAGRVNAAQQPTGTVWPLMLIDLRLTAASTFDLELPAGDRVFAYVIEGQARFGENGDTASATNVVWTIPTEKAELPDMLRISTESGARLLVYASPIISEPIVMKGPFVMNTEQEIEEAFADYRAGRLAPMP